MTIKQSNQLMGVLEKYQMKNTEGIRFDWDAVRQEAVAILSPSQITVLDAIRAQDEFNEALNRRATRPSSSSDSSTPASK